MSAKTRRLRYLPSIFKLLVSQVSRQNMLSSAAVNSLGDIIFSRRSSLLSCCFLSVGRLSLSCSCRYPPTVRCTHLLSPVLEARPVLLECALSQRFSRSGRMRYRVGYYILCASPSVGLRRGCGLSLSVCF